MLWPILIGIAVLVYFLAKNNKLNFSSTNSAQEELKVRYVKGEIDEETYLKMKENIK